jgi:hypothetical protein
MFCIVDESLAARVEGYSRVGVNYAGRFTALSDSFMFDNEHEGIICSRAVETKDRTGDVAWLCAGVSYRDSEGDFYAMPVEAVMYALVAKRYVHDLEIADDANLYARWFAEIEGVPTPRGWGLPRGPVLGFMARNAPEADLPRLTVELHRVVQSVLCSKRAVAGWTEEMLVHLGAIGALSPAEHAQWADADIEDMEFSVRTGNALANAGVRTVGDLMSRSVVELLSLDHFGRKSLHEVRTTLESVGLALR